MSFSFGAPAPSTSAFGTGFGGTQTSAFGTNPTPTFGTAPSATTFGTPSSTSAFGSTTFGTAPTTSTFGTPSSTTFGAPSSSTPFGTPTTNTGFGATTTFGAPTTTPSFGTTPTSGFGATTSGFGSTTTPSFGGFGSTATTTPTTTPSFGGFGSTTTPSFGGFGSTTPIASAIATPGSNVTGTTKFGDLPDYLKKGIEQVRTKMTEQKGISDEIANRAASTRLPRIREEVTALIERAVSICGIVESDKETVAKFRNEDLVRIVKSTEDAYYSLQRQKATTSYVSPPIQLPPSYFWEHMHTLEHRLQQCKSTLNEIERYLQTSAERKPFDPLKLQDLMRHQHEVFIGVAAQVALVHEAMEKQRELYLQYLRKQSPDAPNPFEETKKKPTRTPNPRVSQGGFATPSTPQPTTPSLFSTPSAATTPSASTPSLFGTATATATPLTAAALFSPSSTPSTPSTSAFGSTGTPSFGSSASTPSTAAWGTGLSLSTAAPTYSATTTTTTPSIFGTSTPSTPVSSASLTPGFGSFASPSATNFSNSPGKKALNTSSSSTPQQGRRKARNSK